MEPITGVAVPFVIPPGLAVLRDQWDLAAGLGAGPHVTVLFPFVAVASLTDDIRTELAAIAGGTSPFKTRFERIRRFDGVVWIEPDDATPFQALTTALSARWPEHPPYGGIFDAVIHHLTIAESTTAPLDTIEADARRVGPFTAVADHLDLWAQDGARRWTRRWTMPLGIRP